MEFEYNQRKSDSNLDKHGIDFVDAQELWEGDTVSFVANTKGEARMKTIGRIAGRYWAAIHTERNGKTRITSVRKATDKERSAYDRHINN